MNLRMVHMNGYQVKDLTIQTGILIGLHMLVVMSTMLNLEESPCHGMPFNLLLPSSLDTS